MQRHVLLFSEQSKQYVDQLMTRLNNKIKMFRTYEIDVAVLRIAIPVSYLTSSLLV